MAQKRKVELYVYVNTEREFYSILNKNKSKLICAEIYNEFSGACVALDHLLAKIKLDWSNNTIILLKVLADEIEVLKRFREKSEPTYVFIHENKITKLFQGVHAINLAEVAKKELEFHKRTLEGETIDRKTYDLDEPTPEEMVCEERQLNEKAQEMKSLAATRAEQQELRKRRRAELMVPHLQNLNFVLFWPESKHAHFELYELWDMNNIIMVGREELQLDEHKAREILYAGDALINEASMHALLTGTALAICFRCLDEDVHFVSLVRKILYESNWSSALKPLDSESNVKCNELIHKTAYEYFKHYSLAREEIWQKRREELRRKKEEAKEKKERRLSEMQRLAKQKIKEVREAQAAAREQKKLELLRTGDIHGLEKLEEPDEEVDIVVPEDLSEMEELEDEFEDTIEDENEYFPPKGLVIPGLYAPPNDIAKAHALEILFPKLVLERVVPEPEFLPPHVLVMLDIKKRRKAISALIPHRLSVLHVGIFKATGPSDAKHIAYSAAEYDKIQDKYEEDSVMIAFMLSVKSDLALLDLMELVPAYVSADELVGELECISLFPVYYCNDNSEFRDFVIDTE